jgi:transcriptional regulator with XRE-family HTH domain
MNYFKKVREDYALKQEDLARFLGISRGLLAMGECGTRRILTAAMNVRLTLLSNSREQIESMTDQLIDEANREEQQHQNALAWQREKRLLEVTLNKAEMDLEVINKERQNAIISRAALSNMITRNPLLLENIADKEWFVLQYRKYDRTIRKTNPFNLNLMEAKIAGLKSQLEIMNSINRK